MDTSFLIPGQIAKRNLRHLDEGVHIIDLDGFLVEASDGFCRMLGYSREQLLGLNVAEWDVAYSSFELYRGLAPVFEDREEVTFETTHRRKDGTEFEVEVVSKALRLNGRLGLYMVARDITARKEAEKERLAREEHFRSFFEDSGSVILLVDPLTGEIVAANNAAADFYGYEKKQLTRMSIQEINTLPPEVIRMDRERAFHDGDRRFDFPHRLASGELRDVEVFSSPFILDGRPLLFSIVHDVTERKRSTAALAESEARFRRFFEENSLVMLLVDPADGKIVRVNKKALAFYGYSEEQIVGMPIGQINGLSAADTPLRLGEASRRAANVFKSSHRLASGEHRAVEVYTSPVMVSGRTVMFSIIHDVTERRQAEKGLRDSEERYRATFEQAAVGILHTSFDGRMLRCNARFAEIVGYEAEEIPGLSFSQITHPEDVSTSLKMLPQAESGRATWEKRYIRKDGSVTWVRLTSSTQRDGDGNPVHLITFVEDINDLKAAEGRLEAALTVLAKSA